MENFRRSLRYLWPYRLRLGVALLCVLCIAVLWGGGLGLILPAAKILISDEGLHGWGYKVVADKRLGVTTVQSPLKVPGQEPRGAIQIVSVDSKGPAGKAGIKPRQWIVGVSYVPDSAKMEREALTRALALAPEDMQWWRDAKLGMFLHWGVYAIPGRGEWVMFTERMDVDEYRKLADQFRPTQFDARAWAKAARDAGMRYMVLTARHHDGFCLFDSRASDFTSVKTAAKRDFVAEYCEACREAGLRVGLYYSPMDWRFPGCSLRARLGRFYGEVTGTGGLVLADQTGTFPDLHRWTVRSPEPRAAF